jgi:hypothetical protein
MYFLYVDESGSSGVRDRYRKHLVLLGIAIAEGNWRDIENQVNSLKLRFFDNAEVELKSYDIRNRRSPFHQLSDDKYHAFGIALSELYAALPINILAVVIDVTVHEDPYAEAYRELLNLYSFFLADQGSTGIIILDSRTGQVSHKIGALDNRIKIIHLQEKQLESQSLPAGLDLINTRVLGEVFFVTSSESFGIQLADLAAYAFFHRYEYDKPEYEPFRILEQKIHHWEDGGWTFGKL